MSWSAWASGVLAGIGAPVDATNLDTLWAWSSAESGADVMRWNNPLNTTYYMPGSVNQNSVGVKSYPSVGVGITATVATLTNGYYPTILDHLRRSVPRQQWQGACHDLGIWGTGCGWIGGYYGPAQGGGGVATIDDVYNILTAAPGALQTAPGTSAAGVLAEIGGARTDIATLVNSSTQGIPAVLAAIKTMHPSAAGVDTQAILSAIADLKAHPSFDPNDAAILSIVQRMEGALRSA